MPDQENVETLVKYAKCLDENITLIKKVIEISKINQELNTFMINLQNHIIEEFNQTLLMQKEHNFESNVHYRNGLRFALDYINKSKEQGND